MCIRQPDHDAYALPAPYDKLTWGLDRFALAVVLISSEADALQLFAEFDAPISERLVLVQLNTLDCGR